MDKNLDSKDFKISLMDLPGQYKQIYSRVEKIIKEVLRSARFIQGPQVTAFEQEFAEYCGAKYCIGVSSGTDALIFALRALDIKEGDEVITVPNTFTATVEAICLVGATPVFVDVDPKTMNIDPKQIKKAITKKTRAIIPVHLHGNPADLDEIYRISKEKIAIVEDAAQAHGAKYKGKILGSHRSEFVVFSFHPVKNLGAFGDAGAILTNNKKYEQKIRMMINHGRSGHHNHMLIGTTGRLDTLQAAILSVKLKMLDDYNSKKSFWVNYYKKNLPSNIELEKETPHSESAHHVFAILVENKDKLREFLTDNGIETGMHYPQALHTQPAYRFLGYKRGDFPVAEKFTEQTLSLPLFPHIKKNQIDFVISKIREFYAK